MAEAELFVFRSLIRRNKAREGGSRRIETACDLDIGDLLWLNGPRTRKNVLGGHHPFAHAFDPCKVLSFLFMQMHNGSETSQAFAAQGCYPTSPFSSRVKLASMLSRASCRASPPYWKGVWLSLLMAPSTIAAYSSRMCNCCISCPSLFFCSSASRNRLWMF